MLVLGTCGKIDVHELGGRAFSGGISSLLRAVGKVNLKLYLEELVEETY